MRLILGLLLIALSVWGSLATIAGYYGIDLFPARPAFKIALHVAGPWIAALGGFLMWKWARVWRRLFFLLSQPRPLTRAPHLAQSHPEKPGALEHTACLVMLLGGAALVFWFDHPHPEHVVISGLMILAFIRFAGRELRREAAADE